MAFLHPAVGFWPWCPPQAEAALVVQEEQCGISIPPGDAKALVTAILLASRDPGMTERMGRNAFLAYREKYTVRAAVDNFRRVWNLA